MTPFHLTIISHVTLPKSDLSKIVSLSKKKKKEEEREGKKGPEDKKETKKKKMKTLTYKGSLPIAGFCK